MNEFNERRLEFRADASMNWDRSIHLRIGMRTHGGMMVAKAVEFEKVEPGAFAVPALLISPADATGLMDELWRAGVRPSSGEGNTGQLGAVQYHLEDMRRLVFEAQK